MKVLNVLSDVTAQKIWPLKIFLEIRLEILGAKYNILSSQNCDFTIAYCQCYVRQLLSYIFHRYRDYNIYNTIDCYFFHAKIIKIHWKQISLKHTFSEI